MSPRQPGSCGRSAWLPRFQTPEPIMTTRRGFSSCRCRRWSSGRRIEGARRTKQMDTDVRDRCQAWLEGRRGGLWRISRSGVKTHESVDNDRKRQTRASGLVMETLYQKACGALQQAPPVDVTPEVVNDMHNKHPFGERCRTQPACLVEAGRSQRRATHVRRGGRKGDPIIPSGVGGRSFRPQAPALEGCFGPWYG